MPTHTADSLTPEHADANSLEASLEQAPKYSHHTQSEIPLSPNTNLQSNQQDFRKDSLLMATNAGVKPSKSSKNSSSSSNNNQSPTQETTPFHNSHLSLQNAARKSSDISDKSRPRPNGDEWAKSHVLSLDGGGVRGYSSLLIIKELMTIIEEIETGDEPRATSSYDPLDVEPVLLKVRNIRRPTGFPTGFASRDDPPAKFLPCHYFDLMAGTSTGGLIAIMLGRLRMSIDDAIFEFTTLASEVFRNPRLFHVRSPLFWPRNKYHRRNFENVVRDLTDKYTGNLRFNQSAKLFASDPQMCRTMAVAFEKAVSTDVSEEPYIFRSYGNEDTSETTGASNGINMKRNPGKAHSSEICQIAQATSAAPGYFDPVEIDGGVFCDGGFGCNNPTMEAYHEVTSQNPIRGQTPIGLILSIGTGESYYGRFPKQLGIRGYILQIKAAISHASETREVDRNMRIFAESNDFAYHRLSVNKQMGKKIKLDNWKKERHGKLSTKDEIAQNTQEYLKHNDQKRILREIAQHLVDNRRKRRDTERWSDYLGYRYKCDINLCSSHVDFSIRAFRQHLCEDHGYTPPKDWTDREHAAVLDRCRTLI